MNYGSGTKPQKTAGLRQRLSQQIKEEQNGNNRRLRNIHMRMNDKSKYYIKMFSWTGAATNCELKR
jgi:hypothetical protein